MTIQEAREKAGLTRRQMSERFKIPYRTLQSWELGDRQCPEWAEMLILEKLERIGGAKMRYDIFWVGGENDGEILFQTNDLAKAKAKAYELELENEDNFQEDWWGISIIDNENPKDSIDF